MNRTHLTGWARITEVLSSLGPVSDWTTAVLDQAVLHLADSGQPFGSNDLRLLVPEDDFRKAAQYFATLTGHDALHPDEPQLLRKVGEVVSANPKAHGKRVNTYLLTRAGREFIKARQAERAEQRKAA